jgi:hypothetical protein
MLSIPVGIPEPRNYAIMNKWLKGFPYERNPAIAMFIIGGLVPFLSAWPTVSFELSK